ncbi:RE1-silencing transcription factor isoform X1 [Lingula anatina]|uniref:RE1-silencing transcription factor isoform X1 n=1 Tax=Lingula anatina TaxID=7574 RepID=A0A1S3IJ93_LINAN|nr:RE1-silencing transcription factor isoform X1 [Lingula anatina]|eukprot:XP_013398183.1 RE1-silencing transcription factor isoform X1 [Lingula anatina]
MDSSYASFSKADKKNDTRKIRQFSCPGLLKHKCPHCPFTTLNKYYLWKSHVMRHAGALSCSLDQCNLESKFNRKIGYHKRQLTEDLKTKHGRPRAFRCDICNKAFTFETNVVRHKKIAHVEKLQYLDCPVCHKLFLNALKLEHHMSTKHKQPFTFPSLRCKTNFTSKDMLLKHKKSTHAVKRFRDSRNFNGKLKPCLPLDSGLEPSLMVEKLKVKDFVKGESNTYWLHSGSERTVTVDDYNIQQIGCCNGTKYFSENKTERKQKEDYTMTTSKDKIAPEKPPNKMVLPVPVVRLEKLSRLKICGSHSIHVNNMSVKEVHCNASDTIDVSECTDEQKERKFLGHKYPKYIFSQTGKVEKDTLEKTKVYSRRERKPRQLESYYVSDFVYPWSDSNSECEEDWDCGKERTKSKTVRKRKSRDIEYCMGSEDPEWEPAEGNKKRLKSMLECGVKHKKDLSKSHCGKVSSSVPKSSKSDVMQIRMSDNRKTYVTKRTGFKKVMMIKLAPSAKNAKVEEKITLVKFSNKESECKSQKADKVIVVSKMKDDINTADLFEDEQNNNTADIEKIGKTLENEQEYSQLKPLVERDNIFATLSSLRVQYQEQLSAVS